MNHSSIVHGGKILSIIIMMIIKMQPHYCQEMQLLAESVQSRDGSDVKIRISADADSYANTSAWSSADANRYANASARRSADANTYANKSYCQMGVAFVTEYRLLHYT